MTATYAERVLFVDDDLNLLAAIKRQFHGTYNLVTAESGQKALRILGDGKPFAVVISDMRMPEMNGIRFLSLAAKTSPDTVRVMLTGNADVETAMHAVNEGNIFRFLVKPCQKATMEWALEAAIKQYRLIMAERELLEKTLQGLVQVLTDVLSMVSPVAFSRTSRLRVYARRIAEHLGISKPWLYELAATLSQIGCVTIPADTLVKFDTGAEMTAAEQEMATQHPETGYQLLRRIPRLETVSEMIRRQQTASTDSAPSSDSLPDDPGVLGGLVLKAAIGFDRLILQGHTQPQAVGTLKSEQDAYHPAILEALRQIEVVQMETETKVLRIHDLNDTMVLGEDMRSKSGMLIASQGQQVTLSMRTLLGNYLARREIKAEIRVYVPRVRDTNKRKVETLV